MTAANLKWWFYVASPSAIDIYGQDLDTLSSLPTPDVNGVAWTTKVITLPTPFGNPPCGQVEFSPNSPYVVKVFVQDTGGTPPPTYYSLEKDTIIVRPNGNTNTSCGNFGRANIGMKVDCQNKVIMLFDNTSLAYNNILQPSSKTNEWKLVYPESVGDIPVSTATDVPNVNFPTSVDSKGYVVYFMEYATYDYGSGVTVTVQYKLFDKGGGLGVPFAVNCNTNLCQLSCQMQKFYKLAIGNCGTLVDPSLESKMTQMNFIYTQILSGIFQPLCGIDVPAQIELLKSIGNFDDGCDCGCPDGGGFSNPTGGGSSSSTCCPTSSGVLDINTGSAPAQCPNSYFPVQVYDPTYTSIIGIAYDANSLIALLNSNSAWQAYGVAFNEGNCKVGWYASTQGGVVPDIKVRDASTTSCVNNSQLYSVYMTDLCYPSTPIVPTSFPVNAYVDFDQGAGPVSLGNVASQAALIAALNAQSTKPSTLTFSAGATVDQIIISNSSCSTYTGSPVITCDVGSSSFIMYGASHLQEFTSPAVNAAIEAYGLKTNSLLGKIAGTPTGTSPWHMIRIGNYLITAEGDTGVIYFFDITNPLMPTLARTITLPVIAAGNFSGIPTSLGVGTNVVRTLYSLYFPTDSYELMTLDAIYIFEGLTGSAWKVNFYTGTVTASFQSNKLIGKCPREMRQHIVNSTIAIYFTQDGTLEADISGTSGVLVGHIVTLDVSSFNASGLGTQEILLNQVENVWASSWDGADTIWFVGQLGTIAEYSISANAVTNRYANGLGTYSSTARIILRRGNAKYFAGILYVASLGPYSPAGFGQGCILVDLASLATPGPIQTLFTGNLTNPSAYAHNILPLGNCLLAVTIEANGLVPGYGVILIYKTDGTFLQACALNSAQAIYNLIAIPNVSVYTPNNLV